MKPIVIRFTKEAKTFLRCKTKQYHFDGVSNYIKFLLFNSEMPTVLVPRTEHMLGHMQGKPMDRIAIYMTDEEYEAVMKKSIELGFAKTSMFIRFFSLEYEPSGVRLVK